MKARARRGTLSVIANRRSIRFFSDTPVPDEVVEVLIDAGQRAPCVFQSYTVIRIADQSLRSRIREIAEDDPALSAPVWLLLCLDLRRTSRLLSLINEKNVLRTERHPVETVEMLTELAMFAENVIIASEAMGLGSVLLDWPLREPEEFSRLLKLPEGVVPIYLLCIGQPRESPPLRPRFPRHLVYSVDRYREASDEELLNYLRDADMALRSEGYLKKYADLDVSLAEYLSMKVAATKEQERAEAEVQKFLRRAGLTI
jgi:nitroreductase